MDTVCLYLCHRLFLKLVTDFDTIFSSDKKPESLVLIMPYAVGVHWSVFFSRFNDNFILLLEPRNAPKSCIVRSVDNWITHEIVYFCLCDPKMFRFVTLTNYPQLCEDRFDKVRVSSYIFYYCFELNLESIVKVENWVLTQT